MLDDNQIAIEIRPWTIDRLVIGSCKDDDPIGSCVDRRAEFIEELDTVMRITRPVGGGGVRIGCIDGCIRRRLDRPLQEEMSVADTEVCLGRITEFRSGGYGRWDRH